MKHLLFGLQPFRWISPRIDKTVIDTALYFGPFRIFWKNK